MRILKTITIPTFLIVVITVAGLLFINLFFASQVMSAEIQVSLLNPSNGTLLSGEIYASAQTSSAVSKVEFYFIDEVGRFTFTYEGVDAGNNVWDYSWSTDESIDGVYRVHAVAVDANNSTYLSDINRIYVDNAGGSIPDFDQNTNSTPPGNYNVNQNQNTNQNTNINTNENTNFNANQNTNSENANVNIPSNLNLNINGNANSPILTNDNGNTNSNLNAPVSNTPDTDEDGLSDVEEIETGTDQNDPDTDNDGLTDGFEKEHEFNPLIDDNNTPARSPDQKIIQAINGARFAGAEQAIDSDNDGIPDTVEDAFGSNRYDPDTSNDGLTDGFKANNGYTLLADNSGHIVKKKLELPNPELSDIEKTSLTSTVAIFGVLLLIVVIVLVVFRPKKTE
ncbi:hypothetical protein KKB10_01330 [Patescibacteria group bacterium]|nr:hypothetical protein [Patescibacteria group bacterium]MBU1952111.1 hypothetical protein [Patescibacteria group bacterium]